MEQISYSPLRSIWLKAAVAGSLWASVEIILGSFLHNLRIPFSGAILSFFGVYLVISFFQLWKERGLIWRAGLICALMKSISPSAIILGPMFGIMTEAFLMEFFILLFGKNLFGYMTGGALAVFSSLFQKLINLLILFGFDFVEILKALYDFFIRQIRITAIDPVYLIMLIAGIYLLAGMIAALLGYFSGKRYIRHKPFYENISKTPVQTEGIGFPVDMPQDYSLYYLALAVISMVTCLLLINSGLLIPSLIAASAYLSFSIHRYGKSLRRLMKVTLWLQFIIITFLAAFLWNGISGKAFFSMDGLMVGLKMIFRAIIFITGFSAISIELRNPLIKSILNKKGFSSLYQSLSLSFSALPGIISSMPESKVLLKKPFRAFTILFQQAEGLLQQFESDHRRRPPVVIITGDIQQGKTSFVQTIVQKLKDRGYQISGFLALAIMEGQQRSGFQLFNIQTSETIGLCSLKPVQGWMKQGSFYFNPLGLLKGNEILSGIPSENAQLIVVDEIGPLELSNQGWAKAIGSLCQTSQIPQLWVVRKSLVEKVARNWNVGDVFIFDIKTDSREAVITRLEDLFRSASGNAHNLPGY
jgi:nucleoside-triphosphatase THEP1